MYRIDQSEEPGRWLTVFWLNSRETAAAIYRLLMADDPNRLLRIYDEKADQYFQPEMEDSI